MSTANENSKMRLRAFLLEGDRAASSSEVASWFADLSLERELDTVSRELWKKIELPGTDLHNLSYLLDKIHHRIHLEEKKKSSKVKNFGRFIRFTRGAAALLFVPLLVITILNRPSSPGSKTTDGAKAEIISPMGSRTRFLLPEGTSGWLNGGSKLTYPLSFAENKREVWISGEAFFEVSHDPERPFSVHSGNLVVQARGTSFNMMAYENLPSKEVTLLSGTVEVFNRSASGKNSSLAIMKPNNHLIINLKEGTFHNSEVENVEKYISWTEGKLVFRNDPLASVEKKLEIWYNAEIEVKDDRLYSHTLRATFEEESLEEVLDMISLTMPIRYKVETRKMDDSHQYEKKKVEIFFKRK